MGPRPSVIIVGAGVGGTSSAARLSQAGFDVTVVEKNDFAGGRCSLFTDPSGEHRFDMGPSLYLIPRLFEETFSDLGTSLDAEGIKLVKCEPNYRIVFPDKEVVEMSSDLTKMKKEVEKWEGEKGFEGFLGFLKEGHAHYELSMVHVLHRNFTSLLSLLRPSLIVNLSKLHPFVSVYTRATKYFKTERMRRAFTFAAMYLGMSPFDALGAYNLLQYTEHCEGILYPLGGFGTVPKALQKIAERNGAKFRFNSTVKRVVVQDGAAKGVELEGGEILSADIVLVNADLVWSMAHLYQETAYSKRLEEKPVSCSSISFYWAMNRKIPELGSHTIFLADEYRESFDSIFRDHKIPHEPSFYVNVPSRHDPSAAPADKDTVIVLVPVGHISSALPTSSDWEKVVEETRNKVVGEIEGRLGLSNFRDLIAHETVNTPITWGEKFNLHRGSILGLSHDFFNVLSFRPKTRHPTVKNAYFVGASAHPGTGVPIVLAGARMATTQIIDDLGKKTPSEWNVSSSELATHRTGRDAMGGVGLLMALAALILAIAVYLRQ
uniref:Phytoene desaturase n=1 Tax=Rhodotorula diobovata TaxID=5288 RepID=V5QFM4_9BASI|nr:phytoene dehydrogenase [Rhodotorula diobovata]